MWVNTAKSVYFLRSFGCILYSAWFATFLALFDLLLSFHLNGYSDL